MTLQEHLVARHNRRRAGSWARRKYAQLRRTWLRRNRKLWALATLVGGAIWLVFWWLMRIFPGDQSWPVSRFLA